MLTSGLLRQITTIGNAMNDGCQLKEHEGRKCQSNKAGYDSNDSGTVRTSFPTLTKSVNAFRSCDDPDDQRYSSENKSCWRLWRIGRFGIREHYPGENPCENSGPEDRHEPS